MMRRYALLMMMCASLLLAARIILADTPTSDEPTQPATEPAEQPEQARETADADPVELLMEEITILTEQVWSLRQQLAEAELKASQATRELEELRQFIQDHHQLGTDFEQYKAVKEIAEREDRRRVIEEARKRREAERAERRARYEAAREQQQREKEETDRVSRYHKAGFSSLGLNVFAGRMSFYYKTKSAGSESVRVDYDPYIGFYYRPGFPHEEIDYSSMTISGSVLNAADEVRNIGVAITFFDENGSQVGGEIVQVNNARPDVPYPFTATIDMALNRAFSSSSTYVLYADPVATDEGDN